LWNPRSDAPRNWIGQPANAYRGKRIQIRHGGGLELGLQSIGISKGILLKHKPQPGHPAERY
jgi:hypothetical protein